jgi:hypothetical protein
MEIASAWLCGRRLRPIRNNQEGGEAVNQRSALFAAAAASAMVGALLFVTAASAKSVVNVPCAGQSALVAAINTANSAGGGTIDLARGCEYDLTTVDNSGENGLPVVTTPIRVNGRDATIDGTDSVRVFEVDGPGGSLSMNELTITRGSADVGGAIANFAGTVSLSKVKVTGNAAVLAGGGIASASVTPSLGPSDSVAMLFVRHSTVTDNQQTAGPSPDPNAMGGLGGGGILNLDGTATVDHSWVKGNTAQGIAGGGIASGDYVGTGGETVLLVSHSAVNGNIAPNAGGGGIQNLLGTATVSHSEVDGNTSLNGGAISSGNQGSPNGTADLRVVHSRVNGNTATAGAGGEGPPIAAGGIANGSNATISHSEVEHNATPNGIGAGIVNHGMMAISHSEVNRNTAPATGVFGSGGGILNAQGPPGTTPSVLTISYSQVDHNTAGGFGGGIANGVPLPPGPPPLFGGQLTVRHSQIIGNSAAHGGGIFNNGGTVTLQSSLVTGNHVDNCEPTNTIAGCTG